MLTLRTRLLLAYLAALIPLSIGFGWWAFTVARAGMEAELGRSLSTSAATIAANFSGTSTAGRLTRLEPDSHATRERMQSSLQTVVDATGFRRVRILDPELRSLVDTDAFEPFGEYFDLEAERIDIDRVLAGGQPQSSVLFYGGDGTPYKRGYAAITFEGEAVAVVAVEGNARYFDLLHGFRLQVIVFGLIMLLITVVTTMVVSRRITAPLSALSSAADRIGRGDFETAVPGAGGDEIGRLAAALRKMQEGLAAREEEAQMMLAGIAHEVRNPLGGMELFVGLLEESLEPDGDAAEYAAKVRRELNYLSRVVEEFLVYSRDRPLEISRKSGHAFLDEVRCGVGALVDGGVTMSVVADPADVEISGDLSSLRGVVINLVQNAAQASVAGADIELVLSAPNANTRRIQVGDKGIGMTPVVVANVLRPFFTTREKGTGLGLPLAKKIVTRHGGSLRIESEPGQGTTVTIEIPFRSDAPLGVGSESHIGLDASDWDGEMIG